METFIRALKGILGVTLWPYKIKFTYNLYWFIRVPLKHIATAQNRKCTGCIMWLKCFCQYLFVCLFIYYFTSKICPGNDWCVLINNNNNNLLIYSEIFNIPCDQKRNNK